MQVVPRQPCQRNTALARATCLECRNSHIKCDAQKPKCGRCSRINHDCYHLKSKRGCKGKEKRVQAYGGDILSFDNSMAGPDDLAIQLDALPIDISDIDMEFLTTSSLIASSASGPTRIEARQQQEQFSDHLIDLYYSEFHAVHPLLLPPRMVFSLEFSEYPHYLKSVILFIGAHYSPHCTPNDFKWDPELRRPDGIPSSVHGVQALLLLAIALHARDEQDIATEILDHAIGIAIDIGLHNKSFSEIHSNENHLVAESYRRTWWELYIVDGLFAMFHQSDYFTCYNVKSDVPLPCEEWVYTQQDVLPFPHTLDQLYNRAFASEDIEFSSFAYRIDAVRLLGAILSISKSPNQPLRLDQLDASLVSWFYNLSPSKKLLDNRGKIDEMLFQAHMIVHICAIHLHRPRSNLSTAITLESSSCTDTTERHPSTKKHIHASKTLQAANSLSQLALLQAPVINHTPFFTCAIALSAIIQLSSYSITQSSSITKSSSSAGGSAGGSLGIKGIEEKEQEEATIHEQINLALGVLKVMGETWKIASNVGNRVRNIARGVLERKVEKQDRSTRDVEDVQESWNLERLVGYESSWDDELAGGEDVETMALSPLQ